MCITLSAAMQFRCQYSSISISWSRNSKSFVISSSPLVSAPPFLCHVNMAFLIFILESSYLEHRMGFAHHLQNQSISRLSRSHGDVAAGFVHSSRCYVL